MAVAEPLDTTPSRAPVVYDAFISYSHAKDKAIATASCRSSVIRHEGPPAAGLIGFRNN